MKNPLSKKVQVALSILLLSNSHLFATATADTYTGTPYPDNIPHAVPGIVEAEDFDNGGEGIAYHDTPGRQNSNGQVYRETDVDVQSHGTGLYNIGSTSSGEWTKYTLNVTQAGTYRISTYCVSGSNNGKFHLEMDDEPISRIVNTPNGSWNDYSKATIVDGVQLTEGRHIFTWYTYGGMNLDKFIFERTGEWTGENAIGNFNYPITKKMRNPLFVDFDSPMYETKTIGALYTADPSAHVWKDGRLYVYASHDMEPPQGCDRMDRYHVFSTDDMENWTDHGEILNSSQVPWGLPEGGFMFAPDCAYNPENETYYFYFPHPTDTKTSDSWKIGVATSKEPAANFQLQGYIEGLEPLIDPSVFVDDDGQPYLYHGGGGKCMAGKLDRNDWTKLDGKMMDMEGLSGFHEAAWVHKYKGKYYLSHSDGHYRDGNQLKYAISDNPLGPWKSMGVYMYATGADTNHGSIVEYKGKWYAFYHTANYSGRGSLRSVCFDELEYNEDGSIKIVQNYGTPFKGIERNLIETTNTTDIALTIEAEDFNEGGEHYGYHEKDIENTGNNQTYRPEESVDISTQGDRVYVSRMIKGEWMRYTFFVEKGGLYDIDCLVSSSQNKSRFHVSVNGTDYSGPMIPTATYPAWETVTAKTVLLKEGEQYLDIRMEDGNLNFDKFCFRKSDVYQGKMYEKGNHLIPGTIEAEDYDTGGQGISYFENPWADDEADINSGGAYRKDEGVDLQQRNDGIYISHASSGEWVRYTIDVKEDGIYDVSVKVGTGFGSGEIYLSFDFINEYPEMTANTGGYDNVGLITTKGIELTKGKHIMTLHFLSGGINVDKFIFEKVGNILAMDETQHPSSYIYPNPSKGLFTVDLPMPGTIRVKNIDGRVISDNTYPESISTLDISNAPSGVYIATILLNKDRQDVKLIKY